MGRDFAGVVRTSGEWEPVRYPSFERTGDALWRCSAPMKCRWLGLRHADTMRPCIHATERACYLTATTPHPHRRQPTCSIGVPARPRRDVCAAPSSHSVVPAAGHPSPSGGSIGAPPRSEQQQTPGGPVIELGGGSHAFHVTQASALMARMRMRAHACMRGLARRMHRRTRGLQAPVHPAFPVGNRYPKRSFDGHACGPLGAFETAALLTCWCRATAQVDRKARHNTRAQHTLATSTHRHHHHHLPLAIAITSRRRWCRDPPQTAAPAAAAVPQVACRAPCGASGSAGA